MIINISPFHSQKCPILDNNPYGHPQSGAQHSDYLQQKWCLWSLRVWVLGSNCLDQVLASPLGYPNKLGFLTMSAETDCLVQAENEFIRIGSGSSNIARKAGERCLKLGTWARSEITVQKWSDGGSHHWTLEHQLTAMQGQHYAERAFHTPTSGGETVTQQSPGPPLLQVICLHFLDISILLGFCGL